MDPLELIIQNLDDKVDHWRELSFAKKTIQRLTESADTKKELIGEIRTYSQCAREIEALVRLLRTLKRSNQ